MLKTRLPSASSFCWYWPDRKQGLQAPLSRQALPCLQLRMPCPIGWFYAWAPWFCCSQASAQELLGCSEKQPWVLTEDRVGHVRGALGIGLKALQFWGFHGDTNPSFSSSFQAHLQWSLLSHFSSHSHFYQSEEKFSGQRNNLSFLFLWKTLFSNIQWSICSRGREERETHTHAKSLLLVWASPMKQTVMHQVSLEREKRKQLSPHLERHTSQAGKQLTAVTLLYLFPKVALPSLRSPPPWAFVFSIFVIVVVVVCVLPRSVLNVLEKIRELGNEVSHCLCCIYLAYPFGSIHFPLAPWEREGQRKKRSGWEMSWPSCII